MDATMIHEQGDMVGSVCLVAGGDASGLEVHFHAWVACTLMHTHAHFTHIHPHPHPSEGSTVIHQQGNMVGSMWLVAGHGGSGLALHERCIPMHKCHPLTCTLTHTSHTSQHVPTHQSTFPHCPGIPTWEGSLTMPLSKN